VGANLSNAVIDLFKAVSMLFLGAFLLRILLQAVRADFYNPLSQLILRVTRPLVDPLARVVPKFRNYDLAAMLVLLVLTVIYVQIVFALYGANIGLLPSLFQALVKIVQLTLNTYMAALVIQAILSWVGPGVNNPSANVLWSLNEPLLRPVRRILPPSGNLDLAPLPVILGLLFLSRLLPLHVYL